MTDAEMDWEEELDDMPAVLEEDEEDVVEDEAEEEINWDDEDLG